MLVERKTKRAAKEHEEDVARWQAQRDGVAELVAVAQTFEGEGSAEIMLGQGEALFCKVMGAALIEERRGAGHFQGTSQGVSIPVGRIGGQSIRYRVGANKGTFVQGTPVSTAIDTGSFFITNMRVIFQGKKQTRECLFAKLIGFQHDDAAGSTTFSVSNRQKPTTVLYGPSVAGVFDFRLDLALAHYRGTVDDLVAQLQTDLAQLEQGRPADLLDASVNATPPSGDHLSTPVTQLPEVAEQPQLRSEPQPDAESVPAGWYGDPWSQAPLRWWDGMQWTGSVNEPLAPPRQ